MNKPRVAMNLLWCVPGVGGSEEYLVRQLLGLAELDHEFDVHVFAPRGFAQRQPKVAQLFTLHEAPSDCARREQRIWLEHTWLARQTRHFDVVHHGGGTLPRFGGKHTLLTMHDVQWVDYPHYVRPIKLRYLRFTVPSSLRRATRIAVPSRFVAGTLSANFGVAPSKIAVVRHGLESDFSMDATSEDTLRKSMKLGHSRVLVFPAITHPHKNHEFLLTMMADSNNAFGADDMKLVCAGSQGLADGHVKKLVVDLGLQERVLFPGRVSNADRNGLLKLAEAMVFPSEYEGFGAPVLEAMRLGAPVICSDRASLPEVVGDAGMVCALDSAVWDRALRALPQRREELINAGRERARAFTADISASELLEQYRAVMK